MPTPPAHPTFAGLAHHLIELHPPKDTEVAQQLDGIREAFGRLIDTVGPAIPEPTAEATLAARAIHDACQRCIAAVVLNQG